MGKGKQNAFSIYVKEEFRRRQRQGLSPSMPNLFAELGPIFRDLPEDVKQRYKDKASSWVDRDEREKDSFHRPANQPHQLTPTQRHHSAPQPSTSNPNKDADIKIKKELGEPKRDPEMKQERGEKRSHMELEIYRDPDGQHKSDDPFGERPSKRKPPGYGIPNWKNIKKSNHSDADRYFDYSLFQKRDTCKSIVATRAERVVSIPLYAVACNVLCKYKSTEKEWQFVPIEISIYSYSIEEGPLGQPYNVIINAGPAPNNYFNDSKDHSAKTHKIGFTGANGGYPREARNDFGKIYKELIKYTRAGERTILVPDHKDIDQVKSSIEWLYAKAVDIDETLERMRPSTWTILPLVDFVTETYNYLYVEKLKNPLPKFLLPYELNMRLESCFWDYETEYMCLFHQRDETQTKWCARSCAIRAIKCIEAHLDTIYKMYEEATELESADIQEQPQPSANTISTALSLPNNTLSNQIPTPRSSFQPRQSVQQGLQPMYPARI